MLDNAWIIPALPAISFFLILLMGKRLPRKGSEIGILAVGASFVLSCVALAQWIHKVDTAEKVAPVVHSITWWQNGLVKFSVGTRIDGLSVIVAFVVTFISLLVHVYSTAYMRGDRRYTHFFAMLSLALSMIVYTVLIKFYDFSGGTDGLSVRGFSLAGVTPVNSTGA